MGKTHSVTNICGLFSCIQTINTKCSHTSWLLFFNQASVMWYIKINQAVEDRKISEFIAQKRGTEASQSLRIKLRMFGILILENGEISIFCGNESEVNNSTNIESVLNQKHSEVSYQYMM